MMVVTDIADKVAVGPLASEGVLVIKTKKGGYDTPLSINFDIESGFETPGIWPEYCNAQQFAILSNIARSESGYTQLFSDEDIAAYASGAPADMKYPNADYREMFYRKAKPVSRFAFNANAGSRAVKFNVSLNGQTGSELIKIGPVSDYSKLTLSSSVSAKIGEYLEANASFNGLLTFSRGGNGASFYEANSTPANAFPITFDIDPESEYYDPSLNADNITAYGVSRVYGDNPYASVLEGGYYNNKRRSGMFSSTINYDLSWLVPGLKSKTFASIATFHAINVGKDEDYLAFYWDRSGSIDGRSTTHLGTKEAAECVLGNTTFQSLNMYERLTYDKAFGGHRLGLSATGYILSSASSAKSTDTRLLSGIGSAKYSFKDRYVLDLVANYSGTAIFKDSKKYAFSPSAGLAWLASNEEFLKSVSWIDRLKIRGQVGRNADLDIFGTSDYVWMGAYSLSDGNTGYHFGPRNGASWIGELIDPLKPAGPKRIVNEDLTWPTLFQVDAGVDASLFGWLDARFNWYWINQTGLISNVSSQYSKTMGQSWGAGVLEDFIAMYDNYSRYLYKGCELSLDFHKDWNDFGFSLGLTGRYWDKINSKVTKDFYKYEWQKQSGRHASEHYGFIYLGRFASQEEIDNSALYDPNTKIGDLKYKDLNEDGVINAQDKTFIAPGNAKLRYAVNVSLRYRHFDLNLVGTGQAFFKTWLSSIYFIGGYGDLNYSKFVWDNLCTSDGGAAAVGNNYPRLTYLRNDGNLTCSDYWLRDGGWFKVQSVELAYNADSFRKKWIKGARVSLRASNLLSISGIEYIDPEAPVSGIQASPLYRALTLGVKFTF